MISFKFFRGKIYTDEYTLPIERRMSGRTIAQDLINTVSQTVRDPNYVPASYIPIPEQQRYDNMVIRYVRCFMRGNTNWRGYEEAWMDERNEYVRLKILGGINIGGMMHITYEITTHHTTSQRYRVSVPLINLQRRG